MIDKITKNTIVLFFFLFPLFYLPITSDAYEYNKMMLLFVTCLILFFLFCLKVARRRKFVFTAGGFGVLLFLLSGIALVSTLFQSPNVTVALTTPLSSSTIIAGFFVYLFLVNLIDGEGRERLFSILILASVLISFYVILLYLGFLPASQFTPAGVIFSNAIFLTIIAIYLLNRLIKNILNRAGDARDGLPARAAARQSESEHEMGVPSGRTRVDEQFTDETANNGNLIFYSFSLLIIAGTAIFLTVHLFTDQKPAVLSWAFGWPIFMEVAKNTRTLFLGIGSANFLTAFTLAKPLSFNGSAFWNTVFTSSSSFVLNLATENGLISALLYIFLFLAATKQLIRHKAGASYDYLVPLIAALIFQMIFPSSTAIFTLTIVLLAFATASKPMLTLNLTRLGKLNYLLLLLPVASILAFSYFGGRAYLAEVYFKKSLDALVNKDGTAAYNYEKDAIGLNPYLDRYHVAFSQTNLGLANALASKDKLTDSDKQNIPRLIQQSIDQARIAVILYKTNVVNWDNLAKTYTALINFVTGSDTWAIYAYQQKMILDPLNPQNHIVLGGIYTQLKRYPEAEAQYQQAIKLKKDLASAYYNLGITLTYEQKYKEAQQAFTTTLTLLPIDSDDAKTVNGQLAQLKGLLPQEETTSSAIPSANPNQTLELNQTAPSVLQNLPTPLPTISIPQPPVTP